VRANHTRYAVPSWGVGELWTSDAAVLAHEFRFTGGIDTPVARADGGARVGGPSRARPLEGAESPPTGTVPTIPERVGHGLVSTSQHTVPAGQLDPGELAARFVAYLGGADVRFDDVALDLGGCTPFQLAVAHSLRTIPRGQVVSYAELAALAGYPGAQRAVGTCCARNRFAFLLPCHRVVAAGGLGGYGSTGVAIKRRLLALEGAVP